MLSGSSASKLVSSCCCAALDGAVIRRHCAAGDGASESLGEEIHGNDDGRVVVVELGVGGSELEGEGTLLRW